MSEQITTPEQYEALIALLRRQLCETEQAAREFMNATVPILNSYIKEQRPINEKELRDTWQALYTQTVRTQTIAQTTPAEAVFWEAARPTHAPTAGQRIEAITDENVHQEWPGAE